MLILLSKLAAKTFLAGLSVGFNLCWLLGYTEQSDILLRACIVGLAFAAISLSYVLIRLAIDLHNDKEEERQHG